MQINNIYLGNSLELINNLPVRPNLIILHPPDFGDDFTPEKYDTFLTDICNKCFEKLNDDGILVSITTDRRYNGTIYAKHTSITQIMNSLGAIIFDHKIWAKSLKANLFIPTFAHILCFRKSKKAKIINHRLVDYLADVWFINRDTVLGYPSKDSFPSDLIKRLILNFTNKDDIVLDPFIGSGKTAKVAKNLDRKYIGFEINLDYYNLAIEYINK
jgi:DNA modification methylase